MCWLLELVLGQFATLDHRPLQVAVDSGRFLRDEKAVHHEQDSPAKYNQD